MRVGVAMITSAPEALALQPPRRGRHVASRALKGGAAADYLRSLIARHRE